MILNLRFFADEEGIEQSFGVLRFSPDRKYYALDGQHRLKAIKTLLQPEDEADRVEPPPDFANEEDFSPNGHSPPRVRRGGLAMHRIAAFSQALTGMPKPTDRDTNIIMDEDDIFAILTRLLIAVSSLLQGTWTSP